MSPSGDGSARRSCLRTSPADSWRISSARRLIVPMRWSRPMVMTPLDMWARMRSLNCCSRSSWLWSAMSRMAVARCDARSKSVSVSPRRYIEPTTGWPTVRIATSSPWASRGTARTLWSSLSSRVISGSVRSSSRAGRPWAASQRARPCPAWSRTDSTIGRASPRWVATRYSWASASGSSRAIRVGRTSSPIASRNISSARGRSNPAANARVNSLRTRANAAPSQGSSAPTATPGASGARLERKAVISRVRRILSITRRSTPSSSRCVNVTGSVKSVVSLSSAATPMATVRADGAIARTCATNGSMSRGMPAPPRSTTSISMNRRVFRASASFGAAKTEWSGARTSAAPAARRRTRRSGSCSCRRRNRCRDGEGKIDGEDRAASLPIRRLEARAVCLSDGGADGQAETAAPFLGREERVENPLQEFRRDAGTSVHDGDDSTVRGGGDLHSYRALGRRHLVGVHQEVQEELLELRVVGKDRAWRWARRRDQGDALLAKDRSHRLDRIADRRPQIDRMVRPLARMRERAQAVQQPLHLGDLVVDDPIELGHEPVVGAAAWHQLRESLDRDQRILDLVGDSRRQHLEVREPLGPLPLHLKCLEWREIAEDRDGAQHGAALVVQR